MLSAVNLKPVCLRQQAVDALEEEHIAYAVLHGWQGRVPDDAGDLDLVVAPESLPRIAGALRRHFSVIQILPYAATGMGFVIRPRGQGREQCLIVDCSSDYRWNGLVLLAARELLAERIWCEDHWLVSPRHELAYLLAKKIFEKGCFPPPQRRRIRELVLALGPRAAAVSADLMGERWGAAVCEIIRRQDWNGLAGLVPRLRRAFFRQQLGRRPAMLLRYFLPEIGRWWRRCWRPTGLWVALLGPDGSGKTTLAQNLEQSPPAGFRRTLRFHFRPRLWPRDGGAAVTDPHGRTPRSAAMSACKALGYAVLELLGYLLRLRLALARSTLVICDRYYDDIFLDPLRYRMRRPGPGARIAGWLVPRPDLYVVLLPSWQIIAGRKREVSLLELKSQLAAYRQWAAGHAAAVVVESEGGPAQLSRQIAEIINNLREERAAAPSIARHQVPRAARELLRIGGEEAGEGGGESYAVCSSRDGRRILTSLASPRVAAQGLRLRNPQRASSRAFTGLLRAGLRSGLAGPGARRVAASRSAFLEWLRRVSGENRLHCSLALGPAGPHQKCVLQLMRDDGGVFAYAKVGSSKETIALVRNEADFLRRLAGHKLASLAVPELLYAGCFQEHFVCLTRAPGQALAPAPAELSELHLEALRELRHCLGVPPAAAPAFAPLASLYYRELVENANTRAQQWLGGSRCPACLRHGDFTPWNLRLLPGRLLAFDWEYAREAGTPAYDLVHFFFRSRALRSRGRIYAPALADEHAWRSLLRSLQVFGCGDLDPRALVLLYLSDQAAFLFRTDGRDSAMLRDLAAGIHVLLHR